MKKIILSIDGMTCSACSNGLEKYLNKQDGIISAGVNLVMANATIEYDEKLTIEIETEAPRNSYKYRRGDNSITIKNMMQSDKPLYIVYHNDDNTVNGKYKVVLGGIL